MGFPFGIVATEALVGLIELLQHVFCGGGILVRDKDSALDSEDAAFCCGHETIGHEGVAASLLQQDHGVVEPDRVIGSQNFDHFRDNLPRR